MIDEISLKLVSELHKNGRLSNAKLAQKLGVNVLTVTRRIRELVKKDLITIKAMPNPHKIGYKAGAFIGLGVDLKKIESVCAQLREDPTVNLMTTCFGRFDIILISYFPNTEAMQHFIREELCKIEGIHQIKTYFILSKRREQLTTNASSTSKKVPVSLDNIDHQLVIELIRDGRPNYSQLAQKIGVSTSTVSRRIASLIKENIIWVRAVPNYAKLGYSANAFVLLRVELDKVDKICEQLSKYSEIHLVERLINGYDILFGIDCANPRILYNFFITKIAKMNGILSSETFMRGTFLYLRDEIQALQSMSK